MIATYSRSIFLEMVDLCVWAHSHMYCRRLLRTNRVGVPKVAPGGAGKAACIVAADVSA